MGKIIYCSDLVLRIDSNHEEITNVTEWLLTSTDFRPANPDGCVLKDEMSTVGKVTVILVVWSALIVLTVFYCYFCEQRFFPRQKLMDQSKHPLMLTKEDLASTVITSERCPCLDSLQQLESGPSSPTSRHLARDDTSSQSSLLLSPIRESKVG